MLCDPGSVAADSSHSGLGDTFQPRQNPGDDDNVGDDADAGDDGVDV